MFLLILKYLQDGSGQIHVIKGQLIIVLRCIFIEGLKSLKTQMLLR